MQPKFHCTFSPTMGTFGLSGNLVDDRRTDILGLCDIGRVAIGVVEHQ